MSMTATPPIETILLVEDDELVRRLIRRSLEGQWYRVLSACNGLEALSLADHHRGPIDLLVTDVVMPRMDGFTLGERLVESHPETRVLFISGYADRWRGSAMGSRRRDRRSCSSRSARTTCARRSAINWTPSSPPDRLLVCYH